jgi:hypothetical protein
MAEQFDPYRKWLGIPNQGQAPNHYQLLGIPLGENDPDVIENAANRQMAHVRTFQAGKHGKVSQQILNELSSAKRVLLTADKKSAYDAQLAAQQQASATSLPRPPAMPPATQGSVPPPAEPSVPDTGIRPRGGRKRISRRYRRRQHKSSSFPILVGIVVIAIVVGITMLLVNRKKNRNVQTSTPTSHRVSMVTTPWNQIM